MIPYSMAFKFQTNLHFKIKLSTKPYQQFNIVLNLGFIILVLKSERCTKVTRSKIEARSAKRKSGGLFVPEAQDVYIIFFIYPIGF
ncbi:hypothetical protein Hanom_Chr02g00101621 [Helianthus anomalus]